MPARSACDHQRTVGPALGEDRHRVHVGGEQSVDVVDHARQVLLGDQLLGALRQQVGDLHLADRRVQMEELGEGAGELAGSDHAERKHLYSLRMC